MLHAAERAVQLGRLLGGRARGKSSIPCATEKAVQADFNQPPGRLNPMQPAYSGVVTAFTNR
jgi:hypothetical protein